MAPRGEQARARAFERRVYEFARRERLFETGTSVVAAVSGGPDSSALLLALSALSRRLGIRLTAAYFDHRLRGDDAAARERAAVEELAGRAGLDLVRGGGDVRALAAKRRKGIEEAARTARYGFLAEVAEASGAATVAVGHTADDQAETMLLHLVRGTGIAGLGGMRPAAAWPFAGHDGLRLVRPLLPLPRAETVAYCAEMGFEPARDESNDSKDFARNRVRAEVMPLLRQLNPAVAAALGRLAAAAREDADALDALAVAAVQPEGGHARLDRAALRSMPPALRMRAARLALALAAGDASGFSERHVRALADAAVDEAGGRKLDLPRGLQASARHDFVEVAPRSDIALPAIEGSLCIDVPGEGRLGRFVVRAGAAALEAADAFATADAAAVGASLLVRGWRPGDRMQPAGMRGLKKLQDLFVDARIPRGQRLSLPIFENERGIVWAGGVRLAEWARPREGAPTVLLSFRREQS
jgi:tRNA(Ile)-lysidine synthetase-like protein